MISLKYPSHSPMRPGCPRYVRSSWIIRSLLFRSDVSTVWEMWRIDGVVLAEREALPVLRQQDPAKVRMALEHDAEHVVALALHPVGAAVEPGERRALAVAGAQARAEHQGEAGVQVLETANDLEPLFLPVDRAEPVEVETAQVALGEGGHV